MLRIIAFCAIACAMQVSYAADAHLAAIEKLTTATHLSDHLATTKSQENASSEKQIGQIQAQLEKNFPNLSADDRKAVQAAALAFVKAMAQPWSNEQAAKIYTDSLMQNLPTSEAKSAASFYASPEGQRTLAAMASAEQQMMNYIVGAQKKAMTDNYAVFMGEMKKVVAASTAAQVAVETAAAAGPEVDTPCGRVYYPAEAWQKHEAGTVTLKLLVGPEGTVIKSSIAKSSGSNILDQASLKLTPMCSFKPSLKNGAAETSTRLVPFVWKLN